MAPLEVWIEYASTYSYLTVSRIGRLAAEGGVALRWRPFALGMVRGEQGLGLPFPPESPKTAYMWRDLERRARQLGLAYRRPASYPVNSLLTARVALLASHEGWCQAFSERVFALHWTEGRLIGSDDNLDTALSDLGKDAARERARAIEPANKEALKQQNAQALALGIFGAPSFVVGRELFWGDDRLDEALAWAAAAD